ncbi:MAG: LamG-like jellyroll fold domain-containing protein [archaeon]
MMRKTNLIIIAALIMAVLVPATMANDYALSDGSKIKITDTKKLNIESKGGAFSITSSVDRHQIGDISKTKEWAYEKAGYEIITSDKKLEIVDNNLVCLEGTKQIIIKETKDIKVAINSNPHCIYYPPQIINIDEDNLKVLRTITRIDDNTVKIDFGDNYDPVYTAYRGSYNNSYYWLVWTPYYNITLGNGILTRFYGRSTDKPNLDWTMEPYGGGNGFGSIYANGSWKMDIGVGNTICNYYDVYGGWDGGFKFVCTNENATNEWNFYSTYINLKSTAKFPHRHYFYMDQMNFSSFAMNENGFLTSQSMWYDSNTNYGVAAFGYNQSSPQTGSSWNSSYFMALSWELFDYTNDSRLSTRDFDYETGTNYTNGGISIGRGGEVPANQTISINIKLIKRDLNQSTVKDQYLVPLMTFNDYPAYGDPEPVLNSTWYWTYHSYRKNFTINNAGSETLYGYPQPIRIKVEPEMQSNLVDVLFTDQSGKLLYAELENYNSSEGLAWVRIDVLPKEGTMIYMYWGATGGQHSWHPYVWDDHFIGVWHLNNLNTSDSSKCHNDGIIRGSPSSTEGVFGTGISIDSGDGGDGIDVPNFTELNERITAELFLKPESGDGDNFQRNMCKGASYNSSEWCTYSRYNQSDGAVDFRENGGAKYVRKHVLNKDNAWHYEGMTFDYRNSNDGGNDVRIMLDGVELTNLSAGWSIINTTDTELGLGNQNDQGSDIEADFDEFRVSSIPRSVGWRNQTYNSILKYSTVVTEGAIEYKNGSSSVADETQGRAAIEIGVANSELVSPIIESDVVVYVVYQNGTQKMGKYDKFASDSNKRWAFNYITGSDAFQNLNPLLTIMNFWENQSMTSSQIASFVSGFINNTN